MAKPSRERAESLQAGDVLSFETALERLEGVVERLEAGELPLEEALAAFEEGVQLSRRCAEQLTAAERRIEVLVEQGDGVEVRPFDAVGDDE
jgi:exodeoxyribonuclease VII small subunit